MELKLGHVEMGQGVLPFANKNRLNSLTLETMSVI